MRPCVQGTVLLQLSVLLTVFREVVSQDYYQVADYPDENNYDTNYLPKEPEEYLCYVCTFHLRQGREAGMPECRDPFIRTGIPEVPCKGSCAKMYHKTSDTEYTISRVCLPNCRDVLDEKGYTQCCTGHLCNSGSAASQTRNVIAVLIATLTTALLL